MPSLTEQLLAMGATPVDNASTGPSLTEQLLQMGAQPVGDASQIGMPEGPSKFNEKSYLREGSEFFFSRPTGASPADLQIAKDEKDRLGVVHNTLTSPFRGIYRGSADVVAMLQRPIDAVFGTDMAGDSIRRSNEEESTESDDFIPRTIRGVARSIYPAAAAGKLGGTPGAIAYGALNQANQSYTNARDKGMSPAEAAAYAGTQGSIEAGVTYIAGKLLGGQGLEGRLGGEIAKSATVREAVKRAVVDTLKEYPEEFTIAGLQEAVDQYTKMADAPVLNPDGSLSADSWRKILDLAAQTTLSGGVAASPDIAQAALGGNAQTPQDTAQPPSNAQDWPKEPEATQTTPEQPEAQHNASQPPSQRDYKAEVSAVMQKFYDKPQNEQNAEARRATAEELSQFMESEDVPKEIIDAVIDAVHDPSRGNFGTLMGVVGSNADVINAEAVQDQPAPEGETQTSDIPAETPQQPEITADEPQPQAAAMPDDIKQKRAKLYKQYMRLKRKRMSEGRDTPDPEEDVSRRALESLQSKYGQGGFMPSDNAFDMSEAIESEKLSQEDFDALRKSGKSPKNRLTRLAAKLGGMITEDTPADIAGAVGEFVASPTEANFNKVRTVVGESLNPSVWSAAPAQETVAQQEELIEQQPAADVPPAGETVVASNERTGDPNGERQEEGQGRQGLLTPDSQDVASSVQPQPNAETINPPQATEQQPVAGVSAAETAPIVTGSKRIVVGRSQPETQQPPAVDPGVKVDLTAQEDKPATKEQLSPWAKEIGVKAYESTKLVYRQAKAVGVPRDQWDDVASEAMTKAMESADKYDPKKGMSFNTWYGTIARNAAIDYMRKANTKSRADENAPTRSIGEDEDKAAPTDAAEFIIDNLDKLSPDIADKLKSILYGDSDIAQSINSLPPNELAEVQAAFASLLEEANAKSPPKKKVKPTASKNAGAVKRLFAKIAEAGPGLRSADIEAAETLLNAWLKGYMNVNPDDWVAENVSGSDIAKASTDASAEYQSVEPFDSVVSFTRSGKLLVKSLDATNHATLPRDLALIMLKHLKPDDAKAANDFVGASDNNWTRAQEEKFARAFESFVHDQGKSSKSLAKWTGKLKAVFKSIRAMLERVYEGILDSPLRQKLTPEINGVFERLLGADAKKIADRQARVRRASKAVEHFLRMDSAYATPMNRDTSPTSGPKFPFRSVMNAISKLFDVPIRVGSAKGALGLYNTSKEMMKLLKSSFGNPGVLAHELSHHISNKTDILNSISHDTGIKIEELIAKSSRSARHRKTYGGVARELGASEELVKAITDGDTNLATVLSAREFGIDSPEKRAARVELRNLDYNVRYGTTPADKGSVEEGLAEFFREKITSGADVKNADAITQLYQKWLDANPEMAKRIAMAEKMIGDYKAMNPFERSAQQTSLRGDVNDAPDILKGTEYDKPETIITWFDQFRSRFSNILAVPQKLDQIAAEKGQKFPVSETIAERVQFNLHRAQQWTDEDFANGPTLRSDANYGVRIGEGLKKFLEGESMTRAEKEERNSYGQARMTEIAHDRDMELAAEAKAAGKRHEPYNTGMSIEEARPILAKVRENTAKQIAYDEYFMRLRRFDNARLRKLIDVGLLPQEQYEAMIDSEPEFWMSLVRDIKKEGVSRRSGQMSPLADTASSGNRSRSKTGSDSPVIDPLQILMDRTLETNARIANWKVMDSLARNFDPKRGGAAAAGLMERIDAKDLAEVIKVAAGKILPQIDKIADKYGIQTGNLDQLTKNPDARKEVLYAVLQNRRPDRDNGLYVHMETEQFNPRTGEIEKLKEPRLVGYKFYDPKLFDFLESLSPKQRGMFATFAHRLNKLIQMGATTFRPQFLVTNRLAHDPLAATERTQAQDPRMVYINSVKADKAIIQHDRGVRPSRIIDLAREDIGRISQRIGSVVDSRTAMDYYDRAAERNALKAMTPEQRAEYRKANPRRLNFKSASLGFQHAIESISAMSAYAEEGVRVAEYIAMLDKLGYADNGKGQIINKKTGRVEDPPYAVRLRAGNAGKSITTDFNLAGENARLINDYLTFFGAAVTGLDQSWSYRGKQLKNTLKLFTKDNAKLTPKEREQRGKFLTGVASLATIGASYFLLMNQIAPEEYENEAWWENWFNLRWPGLSDSPILSMNKGRSSMIWINLGEAMAIWGYMKLTGDNRPGLARRAKNLLYSAGYSELIGADSPILLPLEVSLNKRIGYRHGDNIDPQGMMRNLPRDRWNNETTPIGYGIGKAIGMVTDSGPSPIMVDHIGESLTGGIYNTIQQPIRSTIGDRGLGRFFGRKNYYDAPSQVYSEKEAHARYMNSNADKVTPDDYDKKWRLDKTEDIISELSKMNRGETDKVRKLAIERAIQGASNYALGRGDYDRFPNTLTLPKTLPDDVRRKIEDKMASSVYEASTDLSDESKSGKSDKLDEGIAAGRREIAKLFSPSETARLLRLHMTKRGLKNLPDTYYKRLSRLGVEENANARGIQNAERVPVTGGR